jgi:hypothetical protein
LSPTRSPALYHLTLICRVYKIAYHLAITTIHVARCVRDTETFPTYRDAQVVLTPGWLMLLKGSWFFTPTHLHHSGRYQAE